MQDLIQFITSSSVLLYVCLNRFIYSSLITNNWLSMQSMPVWWFWYYYLSPVAWTLYGLIVSQLGDVTTTFEAPGFTNSSVQDYLHSYFGYKHSMVGVCAAVLIGFCAVFWLVFAFSIKFLNFQRRQLCVTEVLPILCRQIRCSKILMIWKALPIY